MTSFPSLVKVSLGKWWGRKASNQPIGTCRLNCAFIQETCLGFYPKATFCVVVSDTVISDLSSKYKSKKRERKTKRPETLCSHPFLTYFGNFPGEGIFCTVADKEVTLMPRIRNAVGLNTGPQVTAMGFRIFPRVD